jgi:hypothetical protein
MTQKTTRGRSQDRRLISLAQAHEVDYWTNALGVSKDELERAISAVGASASAVRRHLGK